MAFKMVDQLPLPVYAQLVVVDATWYRGPLEVEQLQMLLAKLAPVLSRLQHLSNQSRIIPSYGHVLVSAVVLVIGVSIVFRHLVVLSHNFLSFFVFLGHFLFLQLHRHILEVLGVFLHPIQWLQFFFRVMFLAVDTVFNVSVFLVFYSTDFCCLFPTLGPSILFALVFLPRLLGFIDQKGCTCLVRACLARTLLDRRLSGGRVLRHVWFLFGVPFKPTFQARVSEFAFTVFVVQLRFLCYNACRMVNTGVVNVYTSTLVQVVVVPAH